jgi:hypothetical protein
MTNNCKDVVTSLELMRNESSVDNESKILLL